MNASISLFCEHCGAANEAQATSCCFCSSPLVTPSTTDYDQHGCLLADAMLKGRYRIVKVIGQGGMGTVYRALDTELNYRQVAIKELIVRDLSSQHAQEATEGFKREATLLASLQHANLPSVYEHFEEQGRWYMVMSFIQGETLEDYLKRTNRNKLPLPEVLQIGRQICTALHYLHSQQPAIIFRDVKPANIMRALDGQIYLIDFGVARSFEPGQKKDTIPFGSIGYTPPEQFGKAQTTPRSDIYSLGATLHQLLSGHEPDSTPLHLPSLHTLEPTLPKQLATLIELMLEKDEKKRPANMLIVEQNLQEISASTSHQYFSLPMPVKQRKQLSLFVRGMIFLSMLCLVVGGFIGGGIGIITANSANQAHAAATASTQNKIMSKALQLASYPNPYTPKGTFALVDPLNQPGAWQPQSLNNSVQCQFVNGSLQDQIDSPGSNTCDENVIFRNFVFQVNMTIIQGQETCGGLVLREDTVSLGMYQLYVCSDGSYTILRYVPVSGGWQPETLTYKHSNAIKQGPQKNTIAAVANGDNFVLYINNQKITSFTDNLFYAGTLGFLANGSPAIVAYQDAIIWALP